MSGTNYVYVEVSNKSNRIQLAMVNEVDVKDRTAIVPEFDRNIHEAAPLLFIDGMFSHPDTTKWYIMAIANEQANILIDTGICYPTIIRAFQKPEERTLTRVEF